MIYKTEVFSVGDSKFGLKVFINHSHNQIDVEVIDSEIEQEGNPTASITPEELKTLANTLINLDHSQDMFGDFVERE